MNLLQAIGRRIDGLIEETKALIARARRGELPATRVDPDERLGACEHCGLPVTRSTGVRFEPDVVMHARCQAAQGRDRVRTLDAYHAYLDAARRLKGLGDERVTLVVLDVGQRIAKPANRERLSLALDEIADRVAADRSVDAATVAAVRSLAEDAKTSLRGEQVTAN